MVGASPFDIPQNMNDLLQGIKAPAPKLSSSLGCHMQHAMEEERYDKAHP